MFLLDLKTSNGDVVNKVSIRTALRVWTCYRKLRRSNETWIRNTWAQQIPWRISRMENKNLCGLSWGFVPRNSGSWYRSLVQNCGTCIVVRIISEGRKVFERTTCRDTYLQLMPSWEAHSSSAFREFPLFSGNQCSVSCSQQPGSCLFGVKFIQPFSHNIYLDPF